MQVQKLQSLIFSFVLFQRTFGDIITYNGTYSFSIDDRHNQDNPKEPIIDHYPIYYLKFSSEFLDTLKWHMGSYAC